MLGGRKTVPGKDPAVKAYEHSQRKLAEDVGRFTELTEALWLQAMRVHQCAGCAARDLLDKIEVVAERFVEMGVMPAKKGDCLAFCRDEDVSLRPVSLYAGVVAAGGLSSLAKRPGRTVSFADVLALAGPVENMMNAAWEFSDCVGCARSLSRNKIWEAQRKTSAQIPEGRAREGFTRACKRCVQKPPGLV